MDWPTMRSRTNQRPLAAASPAIASPSGPGRLVSPHSESVLEADSSVTMGQMSRANGEIMGVIPTNVGVFFGQVDKRATGWYWVDARSEKLRGAIRGPFETKELAVEDALQGLQAAQGDEPRERGAA